MSSSCLSQLSLPLAIYILLKTENVDAGCHSVDYIVETNINTNHCHKAVASHRKQKTCSTPNHHPFMQENVSKLVHIIGINKVIQKKHYKSTQLIKIQYTKIVKKRIKQPTQCTVPRWFIALDVHSRRFSF